MTQDNQFSDKSDKSGKKETKPVRKIAKWSIPSVIAIVFFLILGVLWLPFSIVFFIIALLIVGFNVLYRETSEEIGSGD
jgi:uncharacterized membrane protein